MLPCTADASEVAVSCVTVVLAASAEAVSASRNSSTLLETSREEIKGLTPHLSHKKRDCIENREETFTVT